MKIDHLTIAGPGLSPLQRIFADSGMSTDYGGPHSNGITHMALLGFDDSSYIEIVSTLTPGARVPLWHDRFLTPQGGTAWTIDVPDVRAAVEAARAQGVAASDPLRVKRHRPDGVVGEWDLAYLGDRQPGGVLPFLIHDITDRWVRSRPSRSVAGKLRGFSQVVLAVEDAAGAARELRKVFPLPDPVRFEDDRFGQLLAFPESPIVLADAPEHRRVFGESPCAAVIAAKGDAYDVNAISTEPWTSFLGRSVGWLKSDLPCRIAICRAAP
jgi:hypothetical protein